MALTNASEMGGQTEFPIILVWADLLRGLPFHCMSRAKLSGKPCARASSRGDSMRMPMSTIW